MPEEGFADIKDIAWCVKADVTKMSPNKIKECINILLFDERAQDALGATDRENLNIVILRDKANHFNFLKGFTKWESIGKWSETDPKGRIIKVYPDENNFFIEVQFKDRKDEKLGKRIFDLLSEYNKKVVKESLLYMYTTPVEESSLDTIPKSIESKEKIDM